MKFQRALTIDEALGAILTTLDPASTTPNAHDLHVGFVTMCLFESTARQLVLYVDVDRGCRRSTAPGELVTVRVGARRYAVTAT